MPAWNENMFIGFSLSGLHRMLPQFDIFTWAQNRFSTRDLYINTTYTALLHQFIIACSDYIIINNIVKDKFSSVIGAMLYSCSAPVSQAVA